MHNDNELSPTRFTDAATSGLRAFPMKPRDKVPATKWKDRPAPTAAELANWNASSFNVGIVCGAPSGIVVLDVDSADAQQQVDALNLPPTPTVRTARGVHIYFQRPAHEVRNTVRLGGVKLDVRGDGGCVVGAGSIHPSGARYEWVLSPNDIPFAPFPEQLARLLAPLPRKNAAVAPAERTPSSLPDRSGLDRLIAEELSEATAEIRAAEEGERNDTLFKIAARMARHVSAAKSNWEPVAAALAEAALAIGLEDPAIAATIESGWKGGSEEPTLWIVAAQEHFFLAYQERFYHVPSGTDLKPSGFNGQFGSLFWGKGTFANFLLRNDYVRKVHDLTYEPLSEGRTISRDGIEWLNTFRPSEIEPIEGDAAPFLDFMSQLVPDESEREHLLRMIAYTVRNPGRKLRYALLLRTAVQGVGKSMLTDIWGALLGRHNVRKTTSKELGGDYQGYLPQTLLVVCEELNLGVGAKTYNDLKDMITSDTALVNEKHLRQRIWPTYATFVFLTNLPVPIQIEQTDRRLFYIDSPAERREPEYYKTFAAWWQANLGVIRDYLDRVDLETFNPYEAPPMTASKERLIADSRSELAQDVALAIRERQGCFDRDLVTLDQVLLELGLFGRGMSKMQVSKALKEAGARSLGQQRVGVAGRASLWAVRNTEYWEFADSEARSAELERTPGIFALLDGTGIDVVHLNLWRGDPALLALAGPTSVRHQGDTRA